MEPTLGFHDVYSIHDSDLLAFIPRPAYALLLTCPQTIFIAARQAELEAQPEYTGSGSQEPVIWYRQTIGHACGLIALLHGLSNGASKEYINQDSLLNKLLQEVVPLEPTERAWVLYNSAELEAAHGAAANLGDTRAPRREEDNANHFICFVKGDDGHLWEMNGGMKGPIDRGVLAQEEDMLSARALELGVRSFMKHATNHEVDFSLVAIAPSLN